MPSYSLFSAKEIVERDIILANDGWTCHLCPSENLKFDHKFQLVTHWHENHTDKEMYTYEMCQWCMEVFDSPTNSMKVSYFNHKC